MNTTPDGKLVRAEDPSADFDPAAIAAFEAGFTADSLDVHSIMVLHHGRVVAEKWWSEGAPDLPHIMNSVSKTWTATAVGFGIAEGLVSLDDKVTSFFPDKVPAEHSPLLDEMTVRHLLTMSTGQPEQPRRSGEDWIANFMAAPVEDAPGTVFRYNSMATFMLSAIMQKVSGQKLTEYLQTRLFGPLAITGYRWDESPDGINTGGWGLYVKTEDMAKLGQLFLQNGVWNGEQLLPEGWAEEASTWKISSAPSWNYAETDPNSDWTHGYCYQMWICRHGAYRADGANGQFIVVIPDKDAVVVLTAGLRDMQAELNLVWDHILPALK
jgi:CubicO group peptidase (beta-lactamase class C family)